MDSAPKSKNGRTAYTEDIAKTIIEACGSGFTLEKAAELVGLNPVTVQGWTKKRPSFGESVRMARKKHELKLLRQIEEAGAKSWQAAAWCAERIYGHAVPSARLQVSGGVEHTATGGFAQLLAGLASRRAEKKAQVIECKEVKAIEQSKNSTFRLIEDNTSCATNDSVVHQSLTENRKSRPVRMKRRKPRAESLEKWPIPRHPPATPPATDSTRITPLNNCDTKQKEDHAQETSQGSAEGS